MEDTDIINEYTEKILEKYIKITDFELLNSIKSYKLIKFTNPKKVKIKPSPKLFVPNELNMDGLEIIDKYIVHFFIKTLENEMPYIEFDNFYNNIKTLTIVTDDKNKRDKNKTYTESYYLQNINLICLNYDALEDAIYHELLHMASSIKHENMFYSGFYQINTDSLFNIGDGLNEGYTQLLTERYFESYCSKDELNSYYLLKVLAQKIENIIGQEEMEKLYFKADLKKLINELSKYTNKSKIIQMLLNMDLLLLYQTSDYNYFCKKSKKCYIKINDLLYEILDNKIENNNKLTLKKK